MGFDLNVVFIEAVEQATKVIFDYIKQKVSRKKVKD